jgi:hypothetical protein
VITDRPGERPSERYEHERRDEDQPKEDHPKDRERPPLPDSGDDAPGADKLERGTKLKEEIGGGGGGIESYNAGTAPQPPKLGKNPEEWQKEKEEELKAERKRQLDENQAKLRAMARSGR